MSGHFEAEPDIASSTEDYASRFYGPVGEWFLDVQMRATLKHIQGLQEQAIVDVGGGHAQTIGGLLEAGHRVTVTGSDESCKTRLEAHLQNPSASYQVCPLTELEFPSETFDVAISYRMMTHLERWDLLVDNLCKVSKKRVIVDYPTYRSFNFLNALLFKLKKGVEKNTRKYNVFHERNIIQKFEANGFQLKARIGQFVFPMALHRAHKSRAIAAAIEGLFATTGISYLFGSPVIACFERIEQ